MPGRIPEQFIDELLARVDIVDVIDARVPLKKAGAEYKACCPFHGEKTPSFTVSPSKQFYHCFGCGAHGSAISFLMEYEHMAFPEAIETLASKAGLDVPRDGREQTDSHTPLYKALEDADKWFRSQLRQPREGKQAVAYLRGRGLSGEISAEYNLGLAPAGYENIASALSDKHDTGTLAAVGLLAPRDDGSHYDRFRERIIFPIRNRRGQVVGFGGRIMGDGQPKYLNSPETAVYHKGRELYGLYEARKASRQLTHMLVVEGYMDVVALAQFGIRNVVAALGTAATSQQIEILFRTVPEVVFCFDGDRAGRQAGWRALLNSLPLLVAGKQVKFLFLPEGEDPDSLIREQGRDNFVEAAKKAVPLTEYFFAHLSDGLDMESIDGRARLAELAREHIAKVRDNVYHDLMMSRLAELVGMEKKVLSKGMNDPLPVARRIIKQPLQIDPSRNPVRLVIALLLAQPALAQPLEDYASLKTLDRKGVDLMLQLLHMAQAEPDTNGARMAERFRDQPIYPALQSLLVWQPEYPAEQYADVIKDALEKLLQEWEQQRMDELSALPSPSRDDTDELRQLFLRQQARAIASQEPH